MQQQTPSIDSILSYFKIDALNEMQTAALKAIRKDGDIVLLADTGSGKTLGFLLPVLQRLDKESKVTQALVIAPSRELALQIESVFKTMGTGFKVSCCYGGHLRETEENNLIQAPVLIIGTPGRLADHLRRGNIKPEGITTLVLDEFDKSLESGFQEEVAFIIGALTGLEKRILTSATDAIDIPHFIGLQQPQRLDFLSGEKKEMLAYQMIKSEDKDKAGTLFKLMCRLGNRSTIIFCNHREAVERTAALLKEQGLVTVWYHGAMEQRDRDSALCKFRNGTSDILVTTDLAARGLDIPNIRYIVHYHLPASEEIFTHRNGRTARVEASGTIILVIGPDEKLPPYITEEVETLNLPDDLPIPDKPVWSTLYVAAGKKDKINKVDIVGFLAAQGGLKKEDIGLIEVKDFSSFVAVRKSKVNYVLQDIKDQKLKGKKIKIDIAK